MNLIENMRKTTPVNTYIGPDCSRMTGPLIREMGFTRAFVICDKNVRAAGLSDRVLDSLQEAGISFTIFDDIVAEPPDTVIDQISTHCRENLCQAVVSIGGGSCIDVGKSVAFLQKNVGGIRAYLMDPARPRTKGAPLIAIPTTAGTGSEVTYGVVVTNSETGEKKGIGGDSFFASAALLDPLLTLSLPPRVTASTAMDAFAHAVESMLGGNSNPNCQLFSLEAIRLISHSLTDVLDHGQDVEKRQRLMYAAYLAGMSLNDGSCNLGHSLAHAIGSQYHVPHGTACAITIPMTIEYFADLFPQRIQRIGESMGLLLQEDLDPQATAKRVADAVRELNRKIGIPSMAQLGIGYTDLPGLAEHALQENLSSMLRPSIMMRHLTEDDLLAPLQREYTADQRSA